MPNVFVNVLLVFATLKLAEFKKVVHIRRNGLNFSRYAAILEKAMFKKTNTSVLKDKNGRLALRCSLLV